MVPEENALCGRAAVACPLGKPSAEFGVGTAVGGEAGKNGVFDKLGATLRVGVFMFSIFFVLRAFYCVSASSTEGHSRMTLRA